MIAAVPVVVIAGPCYSTGSGALEDMPALIGLAFYVAGWRLGLYLDESESAAGRHGSVESFRD